MSPHNEAVRAVGVAILTRQGVEAHVAQQAMYEDPTCCRIAEALTPLLQRLVEAVSDVACSLPSSITPNPTEQQHGND